MEVHPQEGRQTGRQVGTCVCMYLCMGDAWLCVGMYD